MPQHHHDILTIASYSGVRKDLLLFDPARMRSILDIGCFTGATGRYLKAVAPGVAVFGVEYVAEAAERARADYDAVLVADLNRPDALAPYQEQRFDVVLIGDVLEHLVNPEEVLRSLRKMLASDARIYCSLPNIQFWEAIVLITLGYFPRRPRGIFDRTHLRFFTNREARAMFRDAGYHVEAMKRNFRLVDGQHFRALNRLTPVLKPLLWLAAPFFTYQMIYTVAAAETAATAVS